MICEVLYCQEYISTQIWRKSAVKFNTGCYKEWAFFSGPGFALSVHSEC